MNRLLGQFSLFFSRMSARERTLVTVAGAVFFVTVLYAFVLDPLVSGKAVLSAQAARKERELQEMAELHTRYLELAQKLSLGERALAKTPPGFSLFTYLENTISQVLPRQRITSMNPEKKALGPELEEESVEFKLVQVSLEQLVDLLYRIEKSEHPLRVTRLRLKKRPGDPHNFDVVATASLVRSSTG
ncbi:MAG: hypothetical protein KatS3mg076_0121 [Candidatus Binatia bacterium]|nr:MAG: hypothetical protein KatS3mg076_0121 [Candidatus Binatia bacterium]